MQWPQFNKQWLLIALFGVLLVIGGVGTCSNYMPITPSDGKVTPKPPGAVYAPSDVWQPLAAPSKASVEGLKLPEPLKISTSRKWIVVAAQCNSRVRWLITSKSGTPVDALESPLTNSILIFTTGKPNDVIVVLAYSINGNAATDTAVTFITLTGDTPPPNPDPDPNPTPEPNPGKKPSKLHVTFLLDFAKQTRAISDVVNNNDLRTWLTSQGHQVHEVSIHDTAKFNLDTYIEGKIPPLLILQAQGEPGIKEGALVPEPFGVTQLFSVQSVKDAVLKATGKKE